MSDFRLDKPAMAIVRALTPDGYYDQARKVNQGIANDGRPIIEAFDFIPMRSAAGSLWRVRIDDNGNLLPGKKVVET